jgi:hypothetical protein
MYAAGNTHRLENSLFQPDGLAADPAAALADSSALFLVLLLSLLIVLSPQ